MDAGCREIIERWLLGLVGEVPEEDGHVPFDRELSADIDTATALLEEDGL